MKVPYSNQDLSLDMVKKLALDVCLQLKFKNPRWERFLLKKANLESTRFIKLQAFLLDTFRKPY